MAEPLDPAAFLGNSPAGKAGSPEDFLGEGPQASTSGPAGPPQTVGPLRQPLLIGEATKQGLVNAAGLPGDISELGSAAANKLREWVGAKPLEMHSLLPTSEQTREWVKGTPLESDARLTPQSAAERIPFEFVKGAASAGPLSLRGPMLAAGGGGGLAADELRRAWPDAPWWAELGASILGGVGTGGVTTGLSKALSGLTGRLNANTAAMKVAGIPPRSPAFTSADPSARSALAPYAPVEQLAQDIGTSVERSVRDVGASRTWEQAGKAAQDGAQEWRESVLPTKLANAWAPVHGAIPINTPTDINNFRTVVNELVEKGGSLRPLLESIQPQLATRWKKILENMPASPIRSATADTDFVTGRLPAPTVPNWGEVQDLRSELGDLMSRPGAIKDMKEKDLAAAYKALTTDMRVPAERAGVGPAFDWANEESQRLYAFGGSTVDKLLNSTAPGKVVQTLFNSSKKDAGILRELRNEMPTSANEISSAGIRQMALDLPELSNSVVSKNFSQAWRDVPQATKEALVPDVQVRARLDAASNVHNNLVTLPKRGSGVSIGQVGGAGTIGTGLGLLAQHVIGGLEGVPAHVAGAAGGLAAEVPLFVREAYRKALANSPLAARWAGLEGETAPAILRGAAGAAGGR